VRSPTGERLAHPDDDASSIRAEDVPLIASCDFSRSIREAEAGEAGSLARSARAAFLTLAFSTTLLATSARAESNAAPSPSTPVPRAEPFAVSSSALSDSGRLVLAPRDEALSLAVCMAPVESVAGAETALSIAQRGGDASHAVVDGVDVLCAALPTSELPFALWLAARVVQAGRAPRDGEGDVSPVAGAPKSPADPSVALAAKIALEGAVDADATALPRFVVTLTGGVDPTEAERLATQRFDACTGDPHGAPWPSSWHPQQTTERMSTMDADVASPRARYTWIIPQDSQDEAGIRVALEVLGGGGEGRLPRLFRGTHLGKRAEAWEQHLQGGTLSGLLVEPTTRVSIDRIRRFVDGALKQLRLVGPSRHELARARSRLLLDAYRTWEDPVALGRLLSSYELVRGGAERARSAVAALQGITTRDVSRAVQRSLVDARRTTIELYPPAFPADDPRVATQKLYTVLPGDTLTSIAERFHVSIAAIARANDLDPKYALTEGQPLWIPGR
jgi:hypothetical protein